LSFSGYDDDDDNDTVAKPAATTSTETAVSRTSRQISSDVNRNLLIDRQQADSSVVRRTSSGSRDARHGHSSSQNAETKARERLDENYTDNNRRHDTPSQVILPAYS